MIYVGMMTQDRCGSSTPVFNEVFIIDVLGNCMVLGDHLSLDDALGFASSRCLDYWYLVRLLFHLVHCGRLVLLCSPILHVMFHVVVHSAIVFLNVLHVRFFLGCR